MGRLVLRPGTFTGLKVFAATMAQERHDLGEKVTAWMTAHPELEVTEIVVTQSSDSAYHCIAFSVFYRPASGSQKAAA